MVLRIIALIFCVNVYNLVAMEVKEPPVLQKRTIGNHNSDVVIRQLSRQMERLYVATAKKAHLECVRDEILQLANDFCQHLNRFPKSKVRSFVQELHTRVADHSKKIKEFQLTRQVTDFCCEVGLKQDVVKILHDMARDGERVARASAKYYSDPQVQENNILETPQEVARFVLIDVKAALRISRENLDSVLHDIEDVKFTAFVRQIGTELFNGFECSSIKELEQCSFNSLEEVIVAVQKTAKRLGLLAAALEAIFLS